MITKFSILESSSAITNYTGFKLIISYPTTEELAISQTGEAKYEYEQGFDPLSSLYLTLKSPDGSILFSRMYNAGDVLGKPEFEFTFTLFRTTLGSTNIKGPAFIQGRLLDSSDLHKMDEVQIIIYGNKSSANPVFAPIYSITTEKSGYFTMPFPLESYVEAYATVGLPTVEPNYPISLVSSQGRLTFPERLILVVNLKKETELENEKECGCEAMGNFHEQNRILEEFSYISIIRTSDPEIQSFTLEETDEISLGDIINLAPGFGKGILDDIRINPNKVPFLQLRVNPNGPGRSDAVNLTDEELIKKLKTIKFSKTITREFVNRNGAITKDNFHKIIEEVEASKQLAAVRSEANQDLGRVELSLSNQIDWDETPTQYLATSLAYGHILHYKQEWTADGFSLGDLLYSLPLAPGQKKQIAVIDFDRRERASNTQSVDFRESVESSLSRDRDINEIATGIATESIDGSSSSHVGAGGGGFGLALGPVVIGGAGGYSKAWSTASQDAMRSVNSRNMQSLSDRTVQSASAIRSLRSTVVQTVAQSETMSVNTESVANYNHCHAITIQYFEVLRHFKLYHKLTDVEECLFVPLPIKNFDLAKTRRWRESLQRGLRDRSLLRAFNALERVHDRWENSNIPLNNIAEELVLNLQGRFTIHFYFSRPADRPVVNNNVTTYEFESSNWAWFNPLLGQSAEQFYDQFIKNASNRDQAFQQNIGQAIANAIISRIRVKLIDRNNNESADMNVDTTLVSTYAYGAPCTLRLQFSPPINHTRINIAYVKLYIPFGVQIPINARIEIRSGTMGYSTQHYQGSLFNHSSIGNDIIPGDAGVLIYTPVNQNELRNPKKDDLELVNNLIHHLNSNLEYYHKILFTLMPPERRFMILDGIKIKLPKNDPADPDEYRSVASVVKNKLLAVIGNSMVLPVIPGLNLNPDFRIHIEPTTGVETPLIHYYQHGSTDPLRISIPTKGVFAEAMMGKCNSCEKIDESRFWRWEQSPIPDSPTSILPIGTESRRADPGNLQPATMPNPIVNIQNAPVAPDPSGIAATMGLLGNSNMFRDVTGLQGNQQNALAAFQQSMNSAQQFGNMGLDWGKARQAHEINMNKLNAGKEMQQQKLETLKDLYQKGKINKEDMLKGIQELNLDPELSKMVQANEAQKKGEITSDQKKAITPATDEEKIQKLKSQLELLNKAVEQKIIPQSTAESISSELIKNSLGISTINKPEESIKAALTHAIGSGVPVEGKMTDNKAGTTEEFKSGAIESTGKILSENTTSHSISNKQISFEKTIYQKDNEIEIKYKFKSTDIQPIIFKSTITVNFKAGPLVNSIRHGDVIIYPGSTSTVLYVRVPTSSNNHVQDFSVHEISRYGSYDARLSPAGILFELPFPSGQTYECKQSFLNSSGGASNPTHTGDASYAVDFAMPIGSDIVAARDGVVVEIVQNYSNHAAGYQPLPSDLGKENRIVIMHDDYTYSVYGHINTNSSLVNMGDRVSGGVTKLCTSGNNGMSYGPHLHFSVLKAKKEIINTIEDEKYSIEFQFKDSAGNGFVPEKGKFYTR